MPSLCSVEFSGLYTPELLHKTTSGVKLKIALLYIDPKGLIR